MARVGIFSGTFDPVHNGHINFAKAALELGKIDKVIFLPEIKPRGKMKVTPIEQRLTMLKLATADESNMEVRSLPDEQFTIATTLPELQKMFDGDEIVFLMGVDVARNIVNWPNIDKLNHVKLIIAERDGRAIPPELPLSFSVISSDHGHIAASDVRSGMVENTPAAVRDYVTIHNLYNYRDGKK